MNTGLIRTAAIFWASPYSALGLLLGLLSLAAGGQLQRAGHVIECHGRLLGWILRKVPIQGGASAMTLGHVVIAADQFQLDRTRNHELVHVGQYERWGPLFVPAYFACAAAMWATGRDPYLDNPFERAAYDVADY
jgi:hypothetical protein